MGTEQSRNLEGYGETQKDALLSLHCKILWDQGSHLRNVFNIKTSEISDTTDFSNVYATTGNGRTKHYVQYGNKGKIWKAFIDI